MKYLRQILFICLLLCASCAGAEVKRFKLKVLATYPHDRGAYTQGLFFHEGELYESTGQYGRSSFRKVDLTTGKPSEKIDFAKKYFVEGSVIMDGRLYILTWTNKVAFVYDAETLEYKASYSYPYEGWGLTTDGRSLIATDGSSKIYFMDKEFKLRKQLVARLNGKPLRLLNELEYIDGKIWANVYMSDMLVIIDPDSGQVEALVDCSGLLPAGLRGPDTDVLNGIAHNPADGKTYLTGKNWPQLYEVQLVRP